MCKKVLSVWLSIVAILGTLILSSCDSKSADSSETLLHNAAIYETYPYTHSQEAEVSDKLIVESDSIEALEEAIADDINNTIASLFAEFKALISDTTTYEKYLSNILRVEDFYKTIKDTSYQLSVKLCEYGIKYAELILSSGITYDDMYDALDDLYDCVYDDGFDALYDGIYDGILDEMYDTFYDGIIDDASDSEPFDDWYDIRSDAYDIWSDIRSDCYDHWSDGRSDVYDLWSDMRSELFDDDIEGARKEVADFKEDVQLLKNKTLTSPTKSNTTSVTTKPTTTKPTTTKTTTTKPTTSKNNNIGLSDGFKTAMDSYESFMNEYVSFMKKYNTNPSDMELLSEYSNYMNKYFRVVEDFKKWDSTNMNDAELAYYIDVQARVSKKLLEISQ